MAAWVIAGYARTPPPPDPDAGRRWGHTWAQRFHDHAAACGHVLGLVRVDAGHDLEGFHDLLSLARHGQIVAVLVPGLAHLHAVPALAGADPDTIRRYLRARVLPSRGSLPGVHRWAVTSQTPGEASACRHLSANTVTASRTSAKSSGSSPSSNCRRRQAAHRDCANRGKPARDVVNGPSATWRCRATRVIAVTSSPPS
ncbi:MAG: hypothetical protein HY241_05055 [Actinobacteria bacterium]|nr:hypothetical protein [Actinomycetota bacterium]